MNTTLDVRPSPIAGQWYPSDVDELSKLVDGFIETASLPEIDGEVIAVMAPHAGHRYSGPVAGYSFAALRGLKPELIAVLSPMHHPYYEPLLTTSHAAYGTPLGTIEVAHGVLDGLDASLKDRLGFGLTRISNDPEHSLEIELPFLQRTFPDPFQLVPVMVRDPKEFIAKNLGEALAELLQDHSSLLVASTDLSHFYPQHVAEVLDSEVLKQVVALDPSGVIEVEDRGKGYACGRGALAAVMWAAINLGANKAQILNYATSGDVTGDYSQVVGYAAAVFTHCS